MKVYVRMIVLNDRVLRDDDDDDDDVHLIRVHESFL